jgi:hypothetical protein
VTAGEKPAGWDEAIVELTHEINMKCNAAIFEAVAAEREACAKVAEKGIGWPGDAPAAARCIAANIRARGQK